MFYGSRLIFDSSFVDVIDRVNGKVGFMCQVCLKLNWNFFPYGRIFMKINVVIDLFFCHRCILEGRFPESKELKQIIRDRIDPARDLGHSVL